MLIELTGYNRCYAGWLLRHYGKHFVIKLEGKMVELIAGSVKKRTITKRPRYYDDPVIKVLKVIWETFDDMCGQRLGPMIEDMLPIL